MTGFRHTFRQLTDLLSQHKALWAESAFVVDRPSWRADYPELYRALLALSDSDLRAVEQEEDLLRWLLSYLPELEPLQQPWAPRASPQWQATEQTMRGIGARKRAQIEGFVNALLGSEVTGPGPAGSVVDWCSGRGHLAYALSVATGARVLCLERDLTLHHRLSPERIAFLAQDVLEPLDLAHLSGCDLHTALHACGDLHLSMLRQTVAADVPALACSPCCYHFTREQVYAGVSTPARQGGLRPTRDELRLATAETTTANALERSLRQLERLWRVAFDLHLRELRQVDSYSRTPSVRKSLLKTSFNQFARTLVDQLERKGRRDFLFSPLTPQAEAGLMRRAGAKLATISRLEKAQLGFRGALERWLLLDRALFLQEHGYRVEIQEFCARHHSGRNHVILAGR